jgi:hypothetical protein
VAANFCKTSILHFTLDMDIYIRFLHYLHSGRSWHSGERIHNAIHCRHVSSNPGLSHALPDPYNRTGKEPQEFRFSSTTPAMLSPKSSVPFITTVLLANIPQLLLSVWYFTYNAILTRLQLSQEWALYSTSFRPLRVSRPRYLPSLPSDAYESVWNHLQS